MKLDHPAVQGGKCPGLIIQVKPLGRRGLIDCVHAMASGHCNPPGFILIGNAVPAGQPRRGQVIVQGDGDVRQIVEEGLHLFMEQRQPMLRSLMLAPCTDCLIQRIIRTRRAKFDAVILTKPGDCRLVKNDLADRGKLHHIKFFRGPLGGGVKPARTVQRIAKQVQPNRPQIAGRVDVDDSAAHRIIARLNHRWALHKSHPHQKRTQSCLVNAAADLRLPGRALQNGTCRHPLGCCVQRGQQYILRRHPMHQCRKCCHALRTNVGVGRNPVIRQAIPTGEIKHRHVGGKECKRLAQGRHALVIARHMAHRPALFGDFVQDRAGVIAFGHTGERQIAVFSHGIQLAFTTRNYPPSGPRATFWYIPQRAVTKIEIMPTIWV